MKLLAFTQRPSRCGFTLVELLVVIAIIGILTTMVLGAVAISQESAREAKTRSLIMTLNNMIMEEWDSYRTRRLPISMTTAEKTSSSGVNTFANRQLAARRELMRMELPDRWTDVVDGPVALPSRPARSAAYLRAYTNAGSPSAREQDAECLYLIVSMLRSDEATELLNRNSADTDGDGLLEIVDGWGKPIRWLRWPAGYLNNSVNGLVTELQSGDAINEHDPFDPRRRHTEAYLLMPLIYSAGPDKIYDVLGDFVDTAGNPNLHYRDTNWTNSTVSYSHSPYVVDSATSKRIGEPVDFDNDGDLNHHDNIHNHILGLR